MLLKCHTEQNRSCCAEFNQELDDFICFICQKMIVLLIVFKINLCVMKLMHVYIVKCSDKSYYTGVTNDIERRLVEHNSVENPNSYTYKRRPVELVYCEDFGDPMSAFEFEKQVKGWTRKKKEALIEENWENLSELAKCKNLTSHKNFNKNDQSQKSS